MPWFRFAFCCASWGVRLCPPVAILHLSCLNQRVECAAAVPPNTSHTFPCSLCSSPYWDACCCSSGLQDLDIQSTSYKHLLSCDECVTLACPPFSFPVKESDFPFLVLFQSWYSCYVQQFGCITRQYLIFSVYSKPGRFFVSKGGQCVH